jgi:hypothetical protein
VPREGTTTAQLLALLAGTGASNAELCEALGWQPIRCARRSAGSRATSSGRRRHQLPDRRAEVHRYEETEVTEVFGADAPALDQHGYLKTHGGLWVDMERAAAKQISSL